MKDCLSMFSFRNVLNEPTRVTVNSAALIDPVIVSDTCPVLDSLMWSSLSVIIKLHTYQFI